MLGVNEDNIFIPGEKHFVEIKTGSGSPEDNFNLFQEKLDLVVPNRRDAIIFHPTAVNKSQIARFSESLVIPADKRGVILVFGTGVAPIPAIPAGDPLLDIRASDVEVYGGEWLLIPGPHTGIKISGSASNVKIQNADFIIGGEGAFGIELAHPDGGGGVCIIRRCGFFQLHNAIGITGTGLGGNQIFECGFVGFGPDTANLGAAAFLIEANGEVAPNVIFKNAIVYTNDLAAPTVFFDVIDNSSDDGVLNTNFDRNSYYGFDQDTNLDGIVDFTDLAQLPPRNPAGTSPARNRDIFPTTLQDVHVSPSALNLLRTFNLTG